MKKFILFSLALLTRFAAFTQVAVNNNGGMPDNSAMLDVQSTSKGMLIPRMTADQRDAISLPATGLLVFVTDDSTFYYYNGSGWEKTGKWILTGSLLFTDTTLSVGVGTSNPQAKFEVATLNHSGTYGSDVCTGGSASATEEYPGQPVTYAFDDNTSTYWSNNNNLPVWIEYDLGAGNEKRVAKYRIYYDVSATADNSPNDWTFQASNDGTSWTTLDAQTGQGWSATGWKEYTFSNTTRYRYYRLNITDNKGSGNNYVNIFELEMMEESLSNHPTLFVSDNKVGIGTSSPSKTLHVNGSFKLTDGTEAAGKILSTDNNGNASWVDGVTVNGGGWTLSGNYIYSNTGDSVGIGTLNPSATLDVQGKIAQTGTGYSVFLGQYAGENDDLSDNFNVFVGYRAGASNTSGSENTAAGDYALYKNTTGQGNMAAGNETLHENLTGNNNTAAGNKALWFNTSGNNNTANGNEALYKNTTGHSNVAVGVHSLYKNTDRSNLVAIGDSALYNNGTGASGTYDSRFNTALGSKTLYANTKGSWNTATGYQSLYSNTTGYKNTANGTYTLYSNTTGKSNTANGYKSLYSNTTGNYNVANGEAALYSNTTGFSNIAIGAGALYKNNDRSNLVAIGDSALYNNGTGAPGTYDSRFNTALGSKTLYANTTGSWNTATGYQSLYSNTMGDANTAIGTYTLYSNIMGQSNTATGYKALYSNTTGTYNTAVGKNALYSNTESSRNTAVGKDALYYNTTGSENTALGYLAFFNGNNYSNSTALGSNTQITASNQIRLGDGNVTSIGGYADWTNVSDRRFKKDISEGVPGLDFIMKLRPVTYRLDMDAIARFNHTPDSLRQPGAEKTKGAMLQTGFIAQEVEQAAKSIGYDFSGVDAPKNENDFYGLRYAQFVVPLVKAVQEQQSVIEEQNKTITALSKLLEEVESLKKEVQILKQMINRNKENE